MGNTQFNSIFFDEVVDIINGKSQKNVVNDNGQYPIYGSGGIMGYADDYICEKDTVIIGRKGSINSPIYVKEPFWNVDTAFGLCAKKERLDSKFLFYFCEQFNFEALNTTVTIPSLTKANLKKIKIPLPPLPIQKKIVQVLDKAQQLIDLREKQLLHLDELVQSVFYDMFGDPVANTKGWEQRVIKTISEKFSDGPFGSNLKTAHYANEGVRVIRLKNIGIGCFIDSDEAYISNEHYKNVLKKHSCYPGDILIGTLGDPNVRACILPKYIPLAVNKADCVLFRPNRKVIDENYISALINCSRFLLLFTNLVHGQTRSRVSSGQLAKMEIPVPPITLQNDFAEKVQKIEAQKALMQESLEEMKNNYNSLMQRAFKGELFKEELWCNDEKDEW